MLKEKCSFCGRNVICCKTFSEDIKDNIVIKGVKIKEKRLQIRSCDCGAKGTTTVFIGETKWNK